MAIPTSARALRLILRPSRSKPAVLAFVAIVAAATLMVPGAASAVIPSPATPSAVHVTKTSASAFTVAARSANAHKFVVYASTYKPDLLFANVVGGHKSAARRSASSSRSPVTVSGLRYTTKPYYYRVVVYNGVHRRFGPTIMSVGLRPATPTGLNVVTGPTGTYLRWSAGPTTGFQIARASNAPMTQQRRPNYVLRGQQRQYTPYDLAKGHTYYFRVRAINNGTPGTYSSLVRVVVKNSQQSVRVLTFNVLEATAVGQHEGGQTIAAWSKRQAAAVQLIKQTGAELVAIQEAAAWMRAVKGPRQIDYLTTALGGTYGLAHTETPPNEPHYMRTGNYILYKKSAYKLVGTGGHWFIGDAKTAAYQLLENRTSHAKVLFVSPHLGTGAGATYDARRQTETQSLLRQAKAAAHGVPVVYAGDFNTDTSPSGHKFDGPGIAMHGANVASARDVAQSRSNEKYNSANLYMRTPPAAGQSIDYVFAPAGVAVYSWRLILNLSHGRFVTMASDHNPLYAVVCLPY